MKRLGIICIFSLFLLAGCSTHALKSPCPDYGKRCQTQVFSTKTQGDSL